MRLTTVCILLLLPLYIWAQGPHSLLIDITKKEAAGLAQELQLTGEHTKALSNIYVQHALAVEDIIVESDPEVNILKEVNRLEKQKTKAIKGLFNPEDYQLYQYKIEQNRQRAASEFDSLQIHLDDPDFKVEVAGYFDDNVSPYLIYYHQTYLRPELKQKHVFKINRIRLNLEMTQLKIDSLELVADSNYVFDEAITRHLDNNIKELKRLHKRYKDQLDYINVAMGPVEREWNKDYIAMVQSHYKDRVFQSIEDYHKYLNAYGIDYLVGGFSLLLFDVYKPRTYIESREILLDLITTK